MSMMFIGIGTAAVSIGLTTYGIVEQKEAADNAAAVDNATAAYNNKYDQALAEQLDEDTQVNIENERLNDKVYLSKQAVGYAASGVLSTTGSALKAQITNAGRFEQKIQQDWVNSQQQQASYYSQGKAGVVYGAAQAESDRMSGDIALIDGGAKIASMTLQDYNTGVFNFSGGNTGYNNWTDGTV